MNFITKYLSVLLTGVILASLFSCPPALAEEASTDAEVQVLPEENYSYGFRVADASNVVLPHKALHAPDSESASVFLNGWMEIKIKDKVVKPEKISIWAAKIGWQRANVKVYVSDDGRKWKQAGQITVSNPQLMKYDFSGSFGNVNYIKVVRSGGMFSWLLLDAVGAKRR